MRRQSNQSPSAFRSRCIYGGNVLKGTGKPIILALVNEIQNAFQIPEQLQGFSCLDPQKLPNLAYDLKEYGVEQLNKLALFYGNQRQVGNKFQSSH